MDNKVRLYLVWSQPHVKFDGKHGYCSVNHSIFHHKCVKTKQDKQTNKQQKQNNKWFYENSSENS